MSGALFFMLLQPLQSKSHFRHATKEYLLKKGYKTSFTLIEVIYNIDERVLDLRKIFKILHTQ